MDTMLNSEDPDEMQHYAAFHKGLHWLLRLKQSSGTENSHTYCINMYGKTYQNLKG